MLANTSDRSELEEAAQSIFNRSELRERKDAEAADEFPRIEAGQALDVDSGDLRQPPRLAERNLAAQSANLRSERSHYYQRSRIGGLRVRQHQHRAAFSAMPRSANQTSPASGSVGTERLRPRRPLFLGGKEWLDLCTDFERERLADFYLGEQHVHSIGGRKAESAKDFLGP
jgi:hypothetical protein